MYKQWHVTEELYGIINIYYMDLSYLFFFLRDIYIYMYKQWHVTKELYGISINLP